ncbi:MAG: hypothetical protein ACYT04_35705 [Nostoc sp.]
MISAIVLENKRSNARSIYSSKFGFDFNFPRVTKQGYGVSHTYQQFLHTSPHLKFIQDLCINTVMDVINIF